MNKIYKYIMFVLLLGFSTACDEGFDEMNINPTAAITINPAFLLNNAIVGSGYPGSLVYEFALVNQIVAPFGGVLAGGNWNIENRAAAGNLWGSYYGNPIRYTSDIIKTIQDDPNRRNLLNMARIIRARAFMILVDTYGYVPYTEGGAGYTQGVFFPKYDDSAVIYDEIIQELTEATAALDPTGTIETSEVLYFGNIAKWKKFGNSLLLRAGMRLSKVNPTKAASIVAAAFAGGVILDNEDNAAIMHDNNYTNGNGNVLNANESGNYYMTEYFVDFLKDSNDPRLGAFAVRYMGATGANTQTRDKVNFTPADQFGMPLGLNDAQARTYASSIGLAGMHEFSQLDRLRVGNRFAPTYLVTASQNLLLLAEARHRGWITAGTAASYYEQGIRAHFEQLPEFAPDQPSLEIAQSAIDTYVSASALQVGTELQQINEQYWISSTMNGPESWANVRRSGFPTLPLNPSGSRNVDVVNRLTYPINESIGNVENYATAIAAQGPDDLNTKIFWAK